MVLLLGFLNIEHKEVHRSVSPCYVKSKSLRIGILVGDIRVVKSYSQLVLQLFDLLLHRLQLLVLLLPLGGRPGAVGQL